MQKMVIGRGGDTPPTLPRLGGPTGSVDLHTGQKTMSRVDKLKALEVQLKASLDECTDNRCLAQLARQYRETLREVEEIEGVTVDNDEIGDILKHRESQGKPGAVR